MPLRDPRWQAPAGRVAPRSAQRALHRHGLEVGRGGRIPRSLPAGTRRRLRAQGLEPLPLPRHGRDGHGGGDRVRLVVRDAFRRAEDPLPRGHGGQSAAARAGGVREERRLDPRHQQLEPGVRRRARPRRRSPGGGRSRGVRLLPATLHGDHRRLVAVLRTRRGVSGRPGLLGLRHQLPRVVPGDAGSRGPAGEDDARHAAQHRVPGPRHRPDRPVLQLRRQRCRVRGTGRRLQLAGRALRPTLGRGVGARPTRATRR